MRERDLAEKRRLAPGWLDSDAKLLQPEKTTRSDTPLDLHGVGAVHATGASLLDSPASLPQVQTMKAQDEDAAGKELDRAFGGMSMSKKF